ncbi:MAG: hypothetical protein EOM87_02230 [Clostridia bacterium]|nr:hypothetical protein [Clostridia bacterium]
MKKIFIVLLIITGIATGVTSLAACAKYTEYKVTVVADGTNTVAYSYSQNVAAFIISSEDEEILARVIFNSGNAGGVTVNDSGICEFYVRIPAKYTANNLVVKLNNQTIMPSDAVLIDSETRDTTYIFYGPVPSQDMIISVEGLDGEIKRYTYSIPVVSHCPVLIQRGNDYVQLKPESAALLNTLSYEIAFETVEDVIWAVFTAEHGDIIEYYVNKNFVELLSYTREGYSNSAIYNSADFGGEEEGYSAADKMRLEKDGYAMYSATVGNYYYKVTQTVIDDITYIIADDN